jgi:hypothetical protein
MTNSTALPESRRRSIWKALSITILALILVNLVLVLIITCDETTLAKGAAVPAGAIAVGGIIGIPASATCAGGTSCVDPGGLCLGLFGRCTDTFDVTTAVCECQCLFFWR